MGLESANYHFKFKEPIDKEFVEKAFNGKPNFLFNKEGYLIYYSFKFWIDLQIIANDSKISGLSIRIALCNPVEGIDFSFKELLKTLFTAFANSELTDLNTKVSFNNVDGWTQIWNDYKERRRLFESMHGRMELPVSSTLFFKYLDEIAG